MYVWYNNLSYLCFFVSVSLPLCSVLFLLLLLVIFPVFFLLLLLLFVFFYFRILFVILVIFHLPLVILCVHVIHYLSFVLRYFIPVLLPLYSLCLFLCFIFIKYYPLSSSFPPVSSLRLSSINSCLTFSFPSSSFFFSSPFPYIIHQFFPSIPLFSPLSSPLFLLYLLPY